MIYPEYKLEILILPNSTHDYPTPEQYANYLREDQYIKYLEKYLPEFDTAREIGIQVI